MCPVHIYICINNYITEVCRLGQMGVDSSNSAQFLVFEPDSLT